MTFLPISLQKNRSLYIFVFFLFFLFFLFFIFFLFFFVFFFLLAAIVYNCMQLQQKVAFAYGRIRS